MNCSSLSVEMVVSIWWVGWGGVGELIHLQTHRWGGSWAAGVAAPLFLVAGSY